MCIYIYIYIYIYKAFSNFLKMAKLLRLVGQVFPPAVKLKVCESDFVPLWDGATMHRSLAECKLLEAHKSEVMNLGKGCFFRQTQMP